LDATLSVRVGPKRKPSAVGWIARSLDPLPHELQGVAIATLGKVIKRGWDWLGITPAAPAHVHGLIEAPPLAESLTLNKADFIRTGPSGAVSASEPTNTTASPALPDWPASDAAQITRWKQIATSSGPVAGQTTSPCPDHRGQQDPESQAATASRSVSPNGLTTSNSAA
jgi:hypothetical protein